MNLRLLETSHRTSPLWILYIYIYLRERKKHREVRTMAGFIVPPTHSTQENSPNFGSLNHLTAVTNGPWADSPNKMIIWILICCKLPAKPSKLATKFFEEPFQPIWKNLTSEDRKKVIWKDAYIYILYESYVYLPKSCCYKRVPFGIDFTLLPADFRVRQPYLHLGVLVRCCHWQVARVTMRCITFDVSMNLRGLRDTREEI